MTRYDREPMTPLRRRFIDDLRLRNLIEPATLPHCPQCGGQRFLRLGLPRAPGDTS